MRALLPVTIDLPSVVDVVAVASGLALLGAATAWSLIAGVREKRGRRG